MHVVTFYSFKGGVGRTLALVNVGVELANTGRKVLLVDFDLEAPGLDTFKDLAPAAPHAGIVEYVTEYHGKTSAPALDDFYYAASNIGNETGKLWVMPSGKRDASYGARLAAIDWNELYVRHEGFLLLEHLKSQWKEAIEPDYVLIDSRTGHSEVGGICTRQLPNTVVILFMPNEQNFEGVSSVVDAIRAETSQAEADITIELVASNVPSLDDEHQILRSMMRKFERRLIDNDQRHERARILVINRYDSMHLLNQTIFVTERPQSRLAKQYRSLMGHIIRHNLEDREAALRAISKQFPGPTHGRRFSLRAADFESIMSEEAEKNIRGILVHHAQDAEINFMIGQLYKTRGDLDEAQLFFSRAADIALSRNDKEAVKYELEMIETLANQGRAEGTGAKLVEILHRHLNPSEVRQAVELLVRAEASPADEWLDLPAFMSLTEQDVSAIAWPCCLKRKWQQFVIALYRRCEFEAKITDTVVLLAAIGTKNYDLIFRCIKEDELLTCTKVDVCFNLAMAKWGKDGQPNLRLFKHVLELDRRKLQGDDRPTLSANYQQCLALATAITGERDRAKDHLEKSRRFSEFTSSEFSCWRYLRVDDHAFLSDLDEIAEFIDGHAIRPEFMR
jgi:MinD-like ATPase involved in chromosome partitioning or flagellar assembly